MWKKVMENIASIITIAALISICFAGNAYFAKSHEFEQLAAAYQFDKTTQRYNAVQERIWMLEEQCEKHGCSDKVKAEIKHLRLELEALKRELNKKG